MQHNFIKESIDIKNNVNSVAGTGYLDQIELVGNYITVKGWGLLRDIKGNFKIPDKFFLYIDNHRIGHCLPNISRQDICKIYALPDAFDKCGFECTFIPENIVGIENRLSVHYKDFNGNLASLCGPYACVYPLLSSNENFSINKLEGIAISLTTRCNLRCRYCYIHHPKYIGEDIKNDVLDKIISGVKYFSVKEIHYGIMGEPTIYKNILNLIQNNVSNGCYTSMASNFARPLTNEELHIFSLMNCIEVSVDSFDKKHLKEIRGANAEIILMNLCKLFAFTQVNDLKRPDITFSIVCNELNTPDLPQLVGICATIGVRSIQLLDMRKPYPEADFSSLPPRLTESDKADSLRKILHYTVQLCEQKKISVSIDSIIKAFLNGLPVHDGAEFEENTVDKPTRLCIAPWSRMYIYPDGNVTPCCHFSSVGCLSANSSLDDCINGPRMRSIRRELLTGTLMSGC